MLGSFFRDLFVDQQKRPSNLLSFALCSCYNFVGIRINASIEMSVWFVAYWWQSWQFVSWVIIVFLYQKHDCLRVLIRHLFVFIPWFACPSGPVQSPDAIDILEPSAFVLLSFKNIEFFSRGTIGGGPMIGNNRSTSIPTGGETKFHEHQNMVPWTGCRVESSGWFWPPISLLWTVFIHLW